jgi:uncharacterized membrane protein
MAVVMTRAARLDAILAIASFVLIVAVLLLAPHGLLDKADQAAYAVCHRIPERSFSVAGRQLPLCARCSGLYLGAFAGLITLASSGRGRAGRFPARPYALLLGFFMLAWAADGFNSFLALLGLLHLYEPTNRLRLLTGALAGVAVAAVLLPAFNATFWHLPASRRSLERPGDLLWLLAGALTVVLIVLSARDWLLYPLALLSGALVPLLLGALFAMLYLSFTRREGKGERWRELVAPMLVGLGVACGVIVVIGLARNALATAFGLPF